MRAAIIGFAIGTACLQQQAALPEPAVLVAGMAGFMVCLVGGHFLFRRLSQHGGAWPMVFIRDGSAVWPRGLIKLASGCLLYTSPSPRDGLLSRMPSSA